MPIFKVKKKSGHGFCPADGKAKTYSKLFKNDVDKYCPSIDFSIPMNISSLFCKKRLSLYVGRCFQIL